VDFAVSEAEATFRKEVGDWLDRELTPELRREFERDTAYLRVPMSWSPALLEFNRKLGGMGWIGLHWPTRYGGGGRSFRDQLTVVEELAARHARIINSQALHAASNLLVHGSEEQKLEVIPRVARGEIEVALGYTEPEAGSDVANIQMRAVEDGDAYVITGQKIFNTMAHWAAYHWLCARTDPDARPKHRGLTMFLVDLKTPGITVEPLRTIDDSRTNIVFYDGVRVPKRCVVGKPNQGFYIVMEALDKERLFVFNPYFYRSLLGELVEYAKATSRDGRLLAKDAVVREKLAELEVEIAVAEMLYRRAIWLLDTGRPASTASAMLKLFISELGQRLVSAAQDLVGPVGLLRGSSERALLRGLIELGQRATIFHTFGAGGNELMRTIVATRGYGLPAA
jgi:alkylation response protein AidB-like acyl-CoA dehydrogenase